MARSWMIGLLAIYSTSVGFTRAQIENIETNEVNCTQDGFLPNPNNCKEFYWCSLRRRARAIILECESDQIFDIQTQSCTYPWLSTREECGGILNLSNEIENNENLTIQEAEQIKLRNLGSDCIEEGFLPDENDCTKFYRCIDNGRGKFSKHEFTCGPGTIWDFEMNTCNHPWATKNAKCGGKNELSTTELYNPNFSNISPDNSDDIPNPIYNPNSEESHPLYPNYSNPDINPYPEEVPMSINESSNYPSYSEINPEHTQVTDKHEISSESSSISTIDNEANNAINNQETECQQEGFIGDAKDCRKFYRCVANGNKKFIKYEFTCGQGTVWDSEIGACNHDWATKYKNCENKKVDELSSGDQVSNLDNINNGYNPENENDIYNPNNPDNSYNLQTENNPYQIEVQSSSSSSPINQENLDGNNSFVPTKPTNEVTSSSTSNSIENTPSLIQSSTTENSVTDTTSNNIEHNHENPNISCTEDDFIPDPKNCKKFYRCVSNGRNGFTKYEFICGEGTIWDSEAKTCNYPTATKSTCVVNNQEMTNNNTDDNEITTEESASPPTTSTETIFTQNPIGETDEPNTSTVANHNTESSSVSTSSTEKESSVQTITESNENQENVCKQDGFLGDSKNCKIFYRCVNNGKGGFIKYEFSCGEGTVWDAKQETCNYPWAVETKCGDLSSTNQNITTSSEKENLPEYNSTENNSPTDFTNTPSQPTTLSPEGDSQNIESGQKQEDNCSMEGFLADSKNCKKFYRCVSNGLNKFIKYEFTCGEGTVWDSDLETCNYPSSVKNSRCSESAFTTEQENTELSIDQTTTQTNNPITENETEQATAVTENQTDQLVNNQTENPIGTTEIQTDQQIGNQTEKPTETTELQTDQQINNQSENPIATTESQIDKDANNQTEKETNESTTGIFTTEEHTEQTNSLLEQNTTPFTQTEQPNYTQNTIIFTESTMPQTEQPGLETNTQTTVTTDETAYTEKTEIPPNYTTVSVEQSSKPTTEMNNNFKEHICKEEGFFPHLRDCKKFIRCLSNGKGFTKYEFSCGPGTIWDPDLDTCNHPYAVKNKQCEQSQTGSSGNENEKPSSGNDDKENHPSSEHGKLEDKCTEDGFFPSKINCKMFYRCVNNGQGGYTKYDFSCGEGTIWDPNLQTCNYPSATENQACGHLNENKPITDKPAVETTTTFETTPVDENTTSYLESTTDISTEFYSETTTDSTENPTTQELQSTTIDDQTTTDVSKDITTVAQESTTFYATTQPEEQTTLTSTTGQSEQTTVFEMVSTTSIFETTTNDNEKTTTTSDISTTLSSTNVYEQTTFDPTTSREEISNEKTTTNSDISTTLSSTNVYEQTTFDSTTSKEEISTVNFEKDKTDIPTSTEFLNTESTTTELYSTTTQQIETSQNTSCSIGQLEGDQISLVCPTGFKRHPKYCNLFYQCTNNLETMEIKILVLKCPNGTIYDDAKIQCLASDESSQKCEGEIAEKSQLRKFSDQASYPMEIESKKPLCPSEGSFPLDSTKCLNNFIKCQRAPTDKQTLRGFIHQCPNNYTYWPISKRCERRSKALGCVEKVTNSMQSKWMIPVEVQNVSHQTSFRKL